MYVWTEAAEYKHVYTTPYHKAGLYIATPWGEILWQGQKNSPSKEDEFCVGVIKVCPLRGVLPVT